MQLNFITVEDTRLAYLESNPNGETTIFFIHGNSSSSAIWQPQFESKLFSGYRLIAFDLPANGRSATIAEYSLPAMARVLSMAVDQLASGQQYIIAGLSLGVNIVAEMVGQGITPAGIAAVTSCAIGKEYPMDIVFQPGIDMSVSVTDDVPADALEQYWTAAGLCVHDEDGAKFHAFAKDYYAVRDNFRSKTFTTIMAGQIGDEVTLFRQSRIPILVIFGEEEKICNIHYLDNAGLHLWQDQVFKISGAGHFVNIDLPEKTNRLLADFAGEIFRSGTV